jgi:polysaccharide export outer membrane protein
MQMLFTGSVFFGIFLTTSALFAQQPADGPQLADELVQYVRNARRAGLKEQQIQQTAVNAGWPAAVVSDALKAAAASNSSSASDHARSKSKVAAPRAAKVESAPKQLSPDKPNASSASTIAKPGESGSEAVANILAPAKPIAPPDTAKVPGAIDRGVPDSYSIGAGDELQISVWREPDASVAGAVVRPDGKISMPLLKEVSVIGLTPTQVEKIIAEQLAKFMSTADVTVMVKAINSKKIYVVGGVNKEGTIPFTYRMTILQAISEAGGLNDYAKRKKIYVLRHENARDYRIPFDYDAALKGEKMELNIPMIPGDTLVVPK